MYFEESRKILDSKETTLNIIALIQAALEGLASLKYFSEKLEELNLATRLAAIEAKQEKINEGFMSLASHRLTGTDEDLDADLKKIADALNS